MDREKIDRLQELSNMRRQEPLSEELLAEFETLKKEYIQSVKANMEAQLEIHGFRKKQEN